MNKWMTHSELVKAEENATGEGNSSWNSNQIVKTVELKVELRELKLNLYITKIFEWEAKSGYRKGPQLTQVGDSLITSPRKFARWYTDLHNGLRVWQAVQIAFPEPVRRSGWGNWVHPVSPTEARGKVRGPGFSWTNLTLHLVPSSPILEASEILSRLFCSHPSLCLLALN